MSEKSLADYANEAKRQADEERGKKDFYQTPNNIEAHLRLLEWLGHVPCWIIGHVHFLKLADGTKVLTCGQEDCYTCGRITDLMHSTNKADIAYARDSGRRLKINMYIIDMDNRAKGPQLWEPKNTQNCSTWTSLLSLFTNQDEWGARIYKMNEGRIISLTVAKEMRKMKSGMQEIAIQKSLTPGTRPFPIQFRQNPDGTPYQDSEGNFYIRYPLPNNQIVSFKLPDLGLQMPAYDENYHRECWGDSPAEPAEYVPSGEPEGGWNENEAAGGYVGDGGDWGEGQETAPEGSGGDAPWDEIQGADPGFSEPAPEQPVGDDGDWGAEATQSADEWATDPATAPAPEPAPAPQPSSRPPARPAAARPAPPTMPRPAASAPKRTAPPSRPAAPPSRLAAPPAGKRTAPPAPPRKPPAPAGKKK